MSSQEPLKDPDGKPLDPAAQAVVNKARRMSMLSGVATLLGISVVLVMIGYRLSTMEGSVPAKVDVVSALPKGARVIATHVAGDRVIVSVDVGGVTEIRTYDVRTLAETGRLRFVEER